MVWQDIVIGLVSLMFLVGIMAQLRKAIISKDMSSFSWVLIGSTMFGMILLTICMFSLGFLLSAAANFAQFVAWACLLMIKLKVENINTWSDFKK